MFPNTDAYSQNPTLQRALFDFPITNSTDTLTILAVGDVLLHQPLQKQGLTNLDGHRSLWEPLRPWIEQADIAYANLEGPVAHNLSATGKVLPDPGDIFDSRVYTSYPAFNYHNTITTDLKQSGFDVVSTANNHALDRGSKGADLTLDALAKAGLIQTGTRRSTEENSDLERWVARINFKNFKTAWVACAFGTNGIKDQFHQVLNCDSDRQELLLIIHELSNDSSIDAVIVTPHVGIEYETQPRQNIIKLDHSFIDAGALLVFGAHPHVTQKWERYTGQNGNRGLIVYSLGNFVSGQFQRVLTRASVLIEVTLSKNEGHTFISDAQWMPLEMVHEKGLYHVQPMSSNNPSWNHLQSQFGAYLKD